MDTVTSSSVLPAAILGGSAAGALAAFFLVRWELGKLRPAAKEQPSEPAVAVAAPQAAVAVAAPEVVEAEEIGPEVLSVISAVVAAYFGKSARVSAIRRARATPSPWVQQGRVSVQGSHQLARS